MHKSVQRKYSIKSAGLLFSISYSSLSSTLIFLLLSYISFSALLPGPIRVFDQRLRLP
jgi:hypothetical protein